MRTYRPARQIDRRGDRQHAIEASLTELADQNGIVLADLPAGPTERRIAFAVGLGLLGIAVAMAPFASVQLPRIDAWTPITNTYVFVADLATWTLLISQFQIVRRPALLVLASGYLSTAVMGVPLLLTFPGAFMETGLLGAGLQTTGWLSAFWVAGYPLTAIGYAVVKDREPRTLVSHGSSRTGVTGSLIVSVAIVLALTWIATAGEPYLPKLFLDRSRATVNLRYVGAFLCC
jgi:two-component system, sensor histidine kinase and response regulator